MSLSQQLLEIIEAETPQYGLFREVIQFRKLSETAQCPRYTNDAAVGMDLIADEDCLLLPGERRLVHTNIAIELPPHLQAEVRPRSGLALKHGITVVNAPGTIDPDYRGEIGVILLNTSFQMSERFRINRGDRIAQLVIMPFVRVAMLETHALSSTERGEKGYGSTGVS